MGKGDFRFNFPLLAEAQQFRTADEGQGVGLAGAGLSVSIESQGSVKMCTCPGSISMSKGA